MLKSSQLSKYYRPLDIDIGDFTRQFLLTKESHLIPDGWDRYEKNSWCLGTSGLPVLNIESSTGKDIGWCIGYPIYPKDPWKRRLVIECQDSDSIDVNSIENLYLDTGGRYALVLLTENEEKFFLDPCGSLSAVYSLSESTVASTPTLFGEKYDWNEEIIKLLHMPESDRWFPSNLTPKKRIKRLLPNHFLDLIEWKVVRHWPCENSDFTIDNNTDRGVSTIADCLKKTIGTIAERYPIQLTLTAGKDSRMVLACAREYLSDVTLITFSREDERDVHIASKLADMIGLKHSYKPFTPATDLQLLHWLYLTGHAVGGAVWQIHKTFESYDPKRVMLNGIAGEAGGAVGWKRSDFCELLEKKITATEIHQKYGILTDERLLRETDKWLSELSGLNRLNILDLFYLEQQKGCWSSPMFYANTFSRFEIPPINHRRIFQAMMKLPCEYRFQERLSADICHQQWPELLKFPFNEFTGIRRYKNVKRRLVKYNRQTINYAKKFAKKLFSFS